jgi:type IV secretory pathway VirB2 component (pilin)
MAEKYNYRFTGKRKKKMKKFTNSLYFKRIMVTLVLLLVVTGSVFAQQDFGLNTRIATLVKFVNQPWVKGIAFIALVIECIALITVGRQEPQLFKKFLPWIVGTVIFMAAGPITSAFLDLNDGGEGTLDTLDLRD